LEHSLFKFNKAEHLKKQSPVLALYINGDDN